MSLPRIAVDAMGGDEGVRVMVEGAAIARRRHDRFKFLLVGDEAAIKAALDSLDVLSFFGRIEFNTSDAHGLQLGHDMIYIQWQKGSDGKLAKQIVWPAAAVTAKTLYPIR